MTNRFLFRKYQYGHILLTVPIVVMGICIIGYQIAGHVNAKAMAGTSTGEFDGMQTKFCAKQCAALAVNQVAASVQDNIQVTPASQACRCETPAPAPAFDCRTSIGRSNVTHNVGRYGLAMLNTEVGFEVDCGGADKRDSRIKENLDVAEVPLFQFAAFADGPMLLDPASDLEFKGKVHSNEAISLVPKGKLALDDWLTSPLRVTVGKSGRKSEIRFAELSGSGTRVASGDGINGLGKVEKLKLQLRGSDSHALIEWRGEGDNEALRGQKYAWRASLIYRDGWKDNALAPVTLASGVMKAPAGFAVPAYSERVPLVDERDGSKLELLPVNVALLQQHGAEDSIIYLFDDHSDAEHPDQAGGGFLLYNASVLQRPLTIVTNSRMVVFGNYNTKLAYVVPGGARATAFPSALISDAFIQLSRDFAASKTGFAKARRGDYHLPVVVNACILTGKPGPTKHAGYGGDGFLDLIGFEENWTGTPYRVTGSLAQLWDSQTLSGVGGGRAAAASHRSAEAASVRPPASFPAFDPMYADLANMPPGTPRLAFPKPGNGLGDSKMLARR